MSPAQNQALQGILIDESTLLSIEDLCRICAIERNHVIEFVEEGVLEVAAVEAEQWRFRAAALRRARIAMRLQRDLELNLVGVALALDLMDEIESLRREIRARR
jgi:chaperone modulatory protein CbpM